MFTNKLGIRSPLSKFWSRIKNSIVQDVPDGISLCEYDCRKLDCTLDEWAVCERRITKAAGELSPLPDISSQIQPQPASQPQCEKVYESAGVAGSSSS